MDQPDSPVFDEKFEFLGKLGEGGMGAIYKVRHRLLNQILVIKMMTPKSEASPDLHKRFLREAQTATRLRHPSIVSIFDFVLREDGTAYMVMEYLEGANLADALRRCGPMPVSLMLLVADQVLSAMDFMHEKGAIHRDIAPDNIMLTREETGSRPGEADRPWHCQDPQRGGGSLGKERVHRQAPVLLAGAVPAAG